jgi:predicted DNA-binding transcriptional regulator YafY
MRATAATRLERLDLLVSRLKADEPMTLEELAREFGVSSRTLSRDVEILRERGLPIETARGRGGGIRLHWSWGIGRIALSYREAVDLLVSLAIAEQMRSPILMANLAPVRRKLMASFSPSDQHGIRRLKSRILIGRTASLFVQTGYTPPAPAAIERLHEAFLLIKVARIRYRDEKGKSTSRVVEPHFLLLNYPVWYALCWDRLRSDIRTFRCDRMASVQVTEESFVPLRLRDVQKAIDGMDMSLL